MAQTTEYFNIREYLEDIAVNQDDEELVNAKKHVELTQLICSDAWLCRQGCFGFAGAMEQQLQYLGSTLLPSAERRLAYLQGQGIGVSGEDYTYDAFGFVNGDSTSNEKDDHINDEIDKGIKITDQLEFVDGLRERMRTAGIMFVVYVQAHDDLSNMLDQMTYGQIKAKAAQNRKERAAAAAA